MSLINTAQLSAASLTAPYNQTPHIASGTQANLLSDKWGEGGQILSGLVYFCVCVLDKKSERDLLSRVNSLTSSPLLRVRQVERHHHITEQVCACVSAHLDPLYCVS